CIMEIANQGEMVGYELNEGVIRSAERMTYTAVNAILEGDSATGARYAALAGQFEMMRDLAMILNRKRERRGSIDFDLPEPVIEFDEFGLMKSISPSERNIAHRLIEEFMLSANECVAQYLENKRVASLYRIHEKPDAKRVYEFEIIAATFGYSLGVGALPIQRMQLKTDRRATYGTGRHPRDIEIPKEVHITPRMYQKLTQKIGGKPEKGIQAARECSIRARLTALRPGRSDAITVLIHGLSKHSAARSRLKNCTTLPRIPATPSAAPTKPNAN